MSRVYTFQNVAVNVIIIRGAYRIVSYRNERYDTIRYARPTIRYDTIHPIDDTIRYDTTRYDIKLLKIDEKNAIRYDTIRLDANTIRYDTT